MTFAFPKPKRIRRVPKQSKRNAFSKATRTKILERDDGFCQECGRPARNIHHCMPRSRGGRGVVTNGIVVCPICHDLIHRNHALLEKWQIIMEDRYGSDYYKDVYDE